MQALRQRAKEYTAGLMNNFKFRQMYGFSPGPEYQLAFQTAGALPVILASEVPPRFEQYLIVEVTIDTDGRVLDTAQKPIPGLHAAGELVGGLFYFNYPGGTGLVSGSVFGKLAGTGAGNAALKS